MVEHRRSGPGAGEVPSTEQRGEPAEPGWWNEQVVVLDDLRRGTDFGQRRNRQFVVVEQAVPLVEEERYEIVDFEPETLEIPGVDLADHARLVAVDEALRAPQGGELGALDVDLEERQPVRTVVILLV